MKARTTCKPKKAVHGEDLSAEEVLCSNEEVVVAAVSNDTDNGSVVSVWVNWGNRMVHASLDIKKASFSQVLSWAPTYD